MGLIWYFRLNRTFAPFWILLVFCCTEPTRARQSVICRTVSITSLPLAFFLLPIFYIFVQSFIWLYWETFSWPFTCEDVFCVTHAVLYGTTAWDVYVAPTLVNTDWPFLDWWKLLLLTSVWSYCSTGSTVDYLLNAGLMREWPKRTPKQPEISSLAAFIAWLHFFRFLMSYKSCQRLWELVRYSCPNLSSELPL